MKNSIVVLVLVALWQLSFTLFIPKKTSLIASGLRRETASSIKKTMSQKSNTLKFELRTKCGNKAGSVLKVLSLAENWALYHPNITAVKGTGSDTYTFYEKNTLLFIPMKFDYSAYFNFDESKQELTLHSEVQKGVWINSRFYLDGEDLVEEVTLTGKKLILQILAKKINAAHTKLFNNVLALD